MEDIRRFEPARLGVLGFSLLLTLGASHAIAQGVSLAAVSPACIAINRAVTAHAASGRFADAERLLSAALADVGDRSQHVCTGLILHNLSVLMAGSGRSAEAEKIAERSVKILSDDCPPDHPILLRPLQVLAATRFELGETAKAREAFNRMCLVRLDHPQDYALVHGMAAALLHAEGRWQDAEREYVATISAWEQAGRGGTPDAGALLISLGSLYIEERQWEYARRTLGRAATVIDSAQDTVPMDRIRLLHTRAVLYARQGQWAEAEKDLHDAISIADGEAQMDPALVRRILSNYAHVLRKNHHRHEARSIEARAANIAVNRKMEAVVDVADFVGNTKRLKK